MFILSLHAALGLAFIGSACAHFIKDSTIPKMEFNHTASNEFLRSHRSLATCGNGRRGDGRCANGQCCSQYGWCGTSSQHCSGGSGGSSSAGTCGNGSRGNGICANGQCCSQYGWCGTSSAHCAGPRPVAPPVPAPVSSSTSGGTCGNGSRGNGVCANGQCCSQYGWCGTSSAHCGGPQPVPAPVSSGTAGGCSPGWSQASWTTYASYAPCCTDSPNYDPRADRTECDEYSACSYTGDFAYIGHKSYEYVRTNNLIAFFSTHGDNASFGGKKIQISARGKTIEALIADTCGDNDCGGCCTRNAGSSGYLVDMEYFTVLNNYGSIDAASGQVCWRVV